MSRLVPIVNLRLLPILLVLVALAGVGAAPLAAQQEIDSAFSETFIRDLGYPEITITVGPDGVEAPTTLASGYYVVTFGATGEYVGYLDFMQPPAGLDEATATQQALDAGSNDLALPDWVYAGGSNTFDIGVPVSFLIFLAPGEYQIAASYYIPNQGSEEIMRLVPLTVTESATPAAETVDAATPMTGSEPPATVTLQMTDDLRYVVGPDPVPAGPQLWKITNTGTVHAHHVVMSSIPEGITAVEIVADFTGLFSGTPPATEPLIAQFTGVAYAALQSGGQTTWNEWDLAPGSYALICFIIDPMTGVPHVLDGMVTVFTVA